MQGGSYNVGIRGQSDMRKLILQRQFVFVIYERWSAVESRLVFGVELDGRERVNGEVVCRSNAQKNEIRCKHGFELTRIEGSYAYRCSYMKSILIKCFAGRF